MSPIWGHVAGIVTVVLMLAFVGIWVWAWLPQHKRDFDALAELPMEDEDIPPKRAELASPEGGSALGRPGGADISLKRAELATAAVASAMGWRGSDEVPPKRTSFASPQGASALGRPGGADLSPELAELASQGPSLLARQEDAR